MGVGGGGGKGLQGGQGSVIEVSKTCANAAIGEMETIPLRGPEGVPSLPGAPQDEAGLTRKFETSHVGGAITRQHHLETRTVFWHLSPHSVGHLPCPAF